MNAESRSRQAQQQLQMALQSIKTLEQEKAQESETHRNELDDIRRKNEELMRTNGKLDRDLAQARLQAINKCYCE